MVGPVADFFGRYGLALGLLIFAFICSYRLTDFASGIMANPFYIDLGLRLDEIAAVGEIFGLVGTIDRRIPRRHAWFAGSGHQVTDAGSLLVICSNAVYCLFATYGCNVPRWRANRRVRFLPSHLLSRAYPTYQGLAGIVTVDNIALGVHGTAMIAFLSSLTSAKYTATQYAVLSSLYALPGKVLMGTSGFVVNALGYGDFYLYTAALSIPGLLLLLWVSRRHGEIVAARN